MADPEVKIRASLAGAAEAQAGLAALSAATKEVNTSNDYWATAQEKLNRLGQEHRTNIAERTTGTQRLRDHTNELVRKFNDQEAAEKSASSAASQLTASIGGMAARFAATTFSIAAFGTVLVQAFSAGREAELTMVKLDASLTATGNTVGKTTQQLEEMSEVLSKGTRFDATSIQQAMQVLLTFDNVQGDVFESAIRHAQNLSEKFGMDLTSASRLLGRALQEPGEGIQALQRYIGTLNPELVKNIQNLNEQGRTAEAQAEIIALLNSRMKDFATTVGESAPASFDKMKIAWHNLLEEMGKTGQAQGVFAFVEERLDNVTGFFKNWTLIMRGIAIDRDLKFLNEASTTADQRVIIEKRLNDTLTQLNKDAEDERQKRIDAELAAKVKAWDEEEEKQKTSNARKLKENEELIKKIEADEEEAVRKRIELIDIELKAGRMTHTEKLQLLEEELSVQQQGTSAFVALTKERLAVLEELDKQNETTIKRVIERYDIDIKMGRATFEQKIAFINAQIAKEEDGSARWIELMKARQQTEDQMARAREKRSSDEEQALKKRQRSYSEQADQEIADIRKTVFATEDLRLSALENLARGYKNLGADGEEAYDKIIKAMRNVETTAERQTKRLQAALGEAGFDMINVIGGVNSAWATSIGDMLKGAATFSEFIKSMWKGLVDAIISEISRMVARWLAAQAVMGFFRIAGLAAAPATGGMSLATWVAEGGEVIATSPRNIIVGEGGVAVSGARGFQNGGEGIFTRPTMFRAGEGGPERVRVEPLAGGIPRNHTGPLNAFVSTDERPANNRPGEVGVIPRGNGGPLNAFVSTDERPGMVRKGFAMGGDAVVTSPTDISVAEIGPERVKVSPLAAHTSALLRSRPDSGRGDVHITTVFQGQNIMDAFSLRRFQREQERIITREIHRRG